MGTENLNGLDHIMDQEDLCAQNIISYQPNTNHYSIILR